MASNRQRVPIFVQHPRAETVTIERTINVNAEQPMCNYNGNQYRVQQATDGSWFFYSNRPAQNKPKAETVEAA